MTLDSVWADARLLSYADRSILNQRLKESLDAGEKEQKQERIQKLMFLAGSWRDDPRTAEEIMSDIKSMRTTNSMHQL